MSTPVQPSQEQDDAVTKDLQAMPVEMGLHDRLLPDKAPEG